MRWNLAQRAVIVVAYGATLLVLWHWIDASGWNQFGGDGWINVAPNQGLLISDPRPTLHQNLALRSGVQLLLVALWALPSLRILRTNEADPTDPSQPID